VQEDKASNPKKDDLEEIPYKTQKELESPPLTISDKELENVSQ